MNKIFSVVFIKSALDDITECYKILRTHKIEPTLVESMPEYYHFIIKKHTTEPVKAYLLTEYAYLVIYDDNSENTNNSDPDNLTQITDKKEDEEKEEPDTSATIDDIIKHTIYEYTELQQFINKRKVLKDIIKLSPESA
jgi:cbb3-type cytochrome oxidase cytochrome c subunit